MARRCNERGRLLIQQFEDCRLTSYQCSSGVWTIGFGATGPDIHQGLKWTKAQCEARFERDISEREATVRRLVSVPLSDNAFAAIVSFEFNTGHLDGSTLLKMLNGGSLPWAVAEQFGRWVYSGGVVSNGLVRRRNAEKALFLLPDDPG